VVTVCTVAANAAVFYIRCIVISIPKRSASVNLRCVLKCGDPAFIASYLDSLLVNYETFPVVTPLDFLLAS
jgi:hypothetical protein